MIFVCQEVSHSIKGSLHNCRLLSSFAVEALRPQRQHASFFLGGHSDHQNRLAEAVVCVLRLGPGEYGTEVTYADLFPKAAEDRGYELMLNYAKNPDYELAGGKHVVAYC